MEEKRTQVLVEAEQHDRMTSGAVQFVTPKASLETLKSKTEMPSAADVLRTLEKQKVLRRHFELHTNHTEQHAKH
jgi:hypothetical protein